MSSQDALAAREQQLLDEVAAHREFLEQHPEGATFSSRVVFQQIESRIDELETELEALRDEHFTFRLVHQGRESSAIDTSLLGYLLTKLQTALTYTGWALMAGPGVDGAPPVSINRQTSTEVVALAPGSFEVTIRKTVPELRVEGEGTDLLDPALDAFLTLAEAAAQEGFDATVLDVASDLGGQSSRRLSQWFAKLADESMTADLAWSVAPERSVILRPTESRMLSEWLNSVQEKTAETVIVGVLRTADAIKKRFALETETGETREGKADPELLHGAEIDARYRARVRIVVSESEHTTAVTEKLTLLSLERLDRG